MADRPGRQFLQVPGPTNVPDRILRAMHRPAMDFSCPDFMDMATECLEKIKPLFGTSSEVFFYTASGHGAWEAAFANLVGAGDTVLMPETGRFSATWSEMGGELGVNIQTVSNDWRSAIDPDAVEQALRNDTGHKIKAVLVVHVETATGVQSDIKPIRDAIDAAGHPALLVVDAIASFMTTPLPMDALGIDVVIAACQKGLMMPPGLSFNAVSAKALEASKDCGTYRNYWSWLDRMGREQYHRFAGTAPEHLFFALRESITMIEEWGMEAIFARHNRLAEAVRICVGRWSEGGSLAFNAVNPSERADALTVIRCPENVDPDAIRFTSREMFDVAIGGGLGQVAGKVFRIGHMGDLNDPMILGALCGIESTLQRLGVPHESGVLAAIDHLASSAGEPDRKPDTRRVV
jgi:alanine-glyoxylate transaminase/serine-glyoxylate transaminase/serine-pyruvate transaminase